MKRTNSRRTESNNIPIATILSVVGGILMIIGGISIIFMFGWYQSIFGEGVFVTDRMRHSTNDSDGGLTGWWWPGMMMMASSGAMLGGLISLSSLSLGQELYLLLEVTGCINIQKAYKIGD